MIKIIVLLISLITLDARGVEVTFLLEKNGKEQVSYSEAVNGLKLKALSRVKSYIKYSQINSEGVLSANFSEYQQGIIQLFNLRRVVIDSDIWLYANFTVFSDDYNSNNTLNKIKLIIDGMHSRVNRLARLQKLKVHTINSINVLKRAGIDTYLLERELTKINTKLSHI